MQENVLIYSEYTLKYSVVMRHHIRNLTYKNSGKKLFALHLQLYCMSEIASK